MDTARKRQRRQAAGNLVSNLFSGSTGAPHAPHPPPSQPQGNGNSQSAEARAANKAGAGGTRKKPSTAQPRPAIKVLPRGIGPIRDPNCNDVLSGRGGRINAHSGNVQFRNIVQSKKKQYLDLQTKKLDKAHIAADIVQYIRGLDPPGRFLKEDADGAWYDIGDQKAIKKVGQALREDAPDVRQEVGDPSPTDGPPETSPSSAKMPPRPTASAGGDSSEDDQEQQKPDVTPSAVEEPGHPAPSITKSDSAESDQNTILGSKGAKTPHQEMPQESMPMQESTHQKKPVVAVSGRGGKNITKMQREQPQVPAQAAFQTLAYQEIAPPPTYKTMVGTNHQAQVHPHVQAQIQLQRHAQLQQQQQQQALFFAGRNHLRGTVIPSSSASVSGAAAAMMRQQMEDEKAGHFEVPPPRDVAFGMNFHPPRSIVGNQREPSNVSGLSGPSVISGMSALSMNVSALTDPISTVSGNESRRAAAAAAATANLQHNPNLQAAAAAAAAHNHNNNNISAANAVRIQQMRQQFQSYPQTSTSTISAMSANNMGPPLGTRGPATHVQAGSGASIQDVQMMDDTSSFGKHSLAGGGIREDPTGMATNVARDDSMLAGGSTLGSAIGSFTGTAGSIMSGMSFGQHSLEQGGSSKHNHGGRNNGLPSQYYTGTAEASVASMSMNSIGTLSIPGSIMSNLSENLDALDLAEPKNRRFKQYEV